MGLKAVLALIFNVDLTYAVVFPLIFKARPLHPAPGRLFLHFSLCPRCSILGISSRPRFCIYLKFCGLDQGPGLGRQESL